MNLLWWMGAALAADTATIQTAVHTEIGRAMTQLRLPDQEGPYEVEVSLVDGSFATSWSSFGHTISHDSTPYRSARVEVRVGDLMVDSSNFSRHRR